MMLKLMVRVCMVLVVFHPCTAGSLSGSWEKVSLPTRDLVMGVASVSGEGSADTTYAGVSGDFGGVGGVWMSTDGGSIWEHLSGGPQGIPEDEVVTLVRVDETDHTYFAAGGWHGVYVSEDGGETWRYTYPQGNNSIVKAMLMRTRPGPLLLVGFGNGSFYRSTDFGETWEVKIASGPSEDVIENPFEDGKLYAAVRDTIYGSTDRGETWQELSALEGVKDLAIDPNPPHDLYAAATGVSKSTDGGQSWNVVGLDTMALSEIAVLEDSLIVAGSEEYGLLRSTDNGASWQEPDVRFRSAYIREIVPDGRVSGRIWVASHYLDLMVSDDDGISWNEVPVGTDTVVALSMGIPASNPSSLFLGSITKLAASNDLGETWKMLSGGSRSYWDLANHPLDSLTLLTAWNTETEGAVLALSEDGGKSWRTVLQDYFASVYDIAFHPACPDTAFASFFAHYRSTDGGESWESFPVDEGFFGGRFMFDPYDPRLMFLYGGTGYDGSLFRSTDGSLTWQRVTDGLPQDKVVALASAPSRQGIYYCAVGDSSGTVYRSTNGGESWNVAGAIGAEHAPVRDMLVHPDNADFIYLLSKSGMYLSRDGGSQWEDDNAGIDHPNDLYLYSIAVDETARRKLFLLGYALYFTESWLYQRDLDPVSISDGKTESGRSPKSFSLSQNYPNPFNPVTTIEFTLAGKESGKVSLFIYDVRGGLVKKLLNRELDPGTYTCTWDGTGDNGTKVSSGIYFSRIRWNGYAMSRKMIVLQ